MISWFYNTVEKSSKVFQNYPALPITTYHTFSCLCKNCLLLFRKDIYMSGKEWRVIFTCVLWKWTADWKGGSNNISEKKYQDFWSEISLMAIFILKVGVLQCFSRNQRKIRTQVAQLVEKKRIWFSLRWCKELWVWVHVVLYVHDYASKNWFET